MTKITSHKILFPIAGIVASMLLIGIISVPLALAAVSNVGPWNFIKFPNSSDVDAKWQKGSSCGTADPGTQYAIRLDNTAGVADGNPSNNAAAIFGRYSGSFGSLAALNVQIDGISGITEGGSPRMTIGLDTNGDGSSDSFLHQDLTVSGTDLSLVGCTMVDTTVSPWFSTAFPSGLSLCGPCANLAVAQAAYPVATQATFVMVIIDFASITGQNLLVDEFTVNTDVLSKPSDMGKKA
jgi:hypothetical protein